jgi:outer membrane lipoprotein SlyB
MAMDLEPLNLDTKDKVVIGSGLECSITAGTAIGSIVPGAGTLIGAGIGAIAGGLGVLVAVAINDSD